MKKDPILSVIIATYNQEQYIGQTIESILNQKLKEPIEIVIGEDGSTDNTRAICQKYVENYPDIVRLMPDAPNKGLINNYYDTLLSCRGEFIADCAGDDYWCDPHKLERQLAILRDNPEVTLVHSNWAELHVEDGVFIRDARGAKRGNKKTIQRGIDAIEELLTQKRCPFVFLCSALFRRAPLIAFYDSHTTLFRDPAIMCEDFQLLFGLLTKGNFYYEDIETTHYRVYSSSISNSKNPEKQYQFAKSMLILRLTISSTFELFTPAISAHYRYLYRTLLIHTLRCGEYGYLEELKQIRETYPIKWGRLISAFEKLCACKPLFKGVSDLLFIARKVKRQLK